MFKNLKSLFIVTEEEVAAPGTTPATRPAAAASAQNPRPQPAPSVMPPPVPAAPVRSSATPLSSAVDLGAGTVNQSIVEKLLDAIDSQDMEGFDYVEYKRSLKAMDALPMDEATKFRSAFATASTVGASLDKLLASVQYYLDILERQRSNFEAVVQRELDAKVAGREAELASIEREIATKSAEIQRLQADIDTQRSKSSELSAAVEESKVKILTTKTEFAASLDYVKTLFQRDAEKMQQYLK